MGLVLKGSFFSTAFLYDIGLLGQTCLNILAAGWEKVILSYNTHTQSPSNILSAISSIEIFNKWLSFPVVTNSFYYFIPNFIQWYFSTIFVSQTKSNKICETARRVRRSKIYARGSLFILVKLYLIVRTLKNLTRSMIWPEFSNKDHWLVHAWRKDIHY